MPSTHTDAAELPVPEITVHEVKRMIDAGESFILIDVREPHEYEKACIRGAKLIPMDQIPQRMHEIPRDQDIVLQCKVGGRSAAVLKWLRQQGYTRLKNMQGGIKAWALHIDPSMPKC